MTTATNATLRGTKAERMEKAINRKVAKSVKEFNAAVRSFSTSLVPIMVPIAQQKIALDALNKLVKKTPVDLGRARANWQVGINRVPGATLDAKDVAQGEAPAQEGGSSPTISLGADEIRKAPAFSAIHLANNVDYIVWLEDGSSTQAPRGILRPTLAELKTEFP